jgi:hypothetical protein
VRAGYSVSEKRVGHVKLIGDRWHQLTPELVKRAAVWYCVTRNVELSLECRTSAILRWGESACRSVSFLFSEE